MSFKKASTLFTLAFSLAPLSAFPALSGDIGKLGDTCYDIKTMGWNEQEAYYKDLYFQPWIFNTSKAGWQQEFSHTDEMFSNMIEISESVKDVAFFGGRAQRENPTTYSHDYALNGEHIINDNGFKSQTFGWTQIIGDNYDSGEVDCNAIDLFSDSDSDGDDTPPGIRAALIARLKGTSQSERQQKLALLINSLLLPKNVTAAGGLATQGYVNDLADTIFDRLPTRKFTPAGIEAENTDVDLSTITLDETIYSESNNLTSIYTDSNGTRVWTRGFAGSKQPYSTGGAYDKNGSYYPDAYNDFYSNHGGFVIGVDTSVTENIQLGVFGNYGTINLNQFDQGFGGGSWNPTGFGGGITASYVDESFYVQGLFGATGFSGDNKRQIRIPGVIDETYTASKNTTSYVGALRVGAPFTWGNTILEPQATAIWNGNNDSSYTESGRYEAFSLKVDSYSDNFLETTIGAKLAWPIKQSNGNLLVPNVRLAWLADWDTGNGAVKFKRKNSKADITPDIPSNQEMQNGVLLEGGVDYAIVQGSTSAWKLYAKGGAKVWANANTDWRASGGVTFSFGGAPQGSTTIEVVEELSVEPAPEPAPAAPAPVRGLW